MTTILERNNPILRKVAAEVREDEVGGAELRRAVRDMQTALVREEDGIAIAAPQIGVSKRIFVVSGKIFSIITKKERVGGAPKIRDLVFINPKITKRSRERHEVEEGCLSVRWAYGKVRRAAKVTIEATDETGRRFSRGASGLLAQIFQHEIDHLDGILFIDTATDIREVPPDAKERKL